ncbi:Asp23/Gls24 family envelope stress response protein [Actinomadura alba]|uniref:Asp23/Gls24 family envelope stress response protein n=1 Tax=Actinomadura alba TaxID=406431 RepID=UPI0031E1F394
MSELDNGYPHASGGGTEGAPGDVGPLPFFPAPQGPTSGPHPAMPLSAPIPPAPPPAAPGQPQPAGRHTQTADQQQPPPLIPSQGPAPAAEPPPGSPMARSAVVKGRIKVEDEVVEKIAALAALEVQGIAGLGVTVDGAGEPPRGPIPAGQRRGGQGVQAKVQENEVSLDVTVVVEYGSIVMEVAKAVKSNVARVTSRMLGMRVTSVNITVHDVHIPGERGAAAALARGQAAAETA